MSRIACLCLGWMLVCSSAAFGQDPKEADYYALTTFKIPEAISLETGAFEFLPDGRLAVGTRRGEVYLVSNVETGGPNDLKFERFAHGLHEVLGLAWRDGWLYVVQRPEVSRIRDTDGDGVADDFETFCDDWGINGDYHEYAFGSKFDKEGTLWVVLCLTGSFSSEVPYRGWCLRINPQGKAIPTVSGLRSPGGIGANAAGDMFYTDNQGPWNGTCGLKCLQPGAFVGHPGGNKWYSLAKEVLGTPPTEPKSESRMMVEAKKIPELYPTSVFLPYNRMGQSASGVACDLTAGKFGPFTEQLFIGDQTHSTVMRVSLEKVKGRYQGALYPFRAGFASGTLPLQYSPSGKLVVGGTNRGWGSRGPKPFSLERLDWTGKVPFEILEMQVRPDGFELLFTAPVDAETAGNVKSYAMETFTYIYQASYGSPEVDQTDAKVLSATVSEDRKRVRLKIDGLQEGHLHHLKAAAVKSADGRPLLHSEAYYTLNYFPE